MSSRLGLVAALLLLAGCGGHSGDPQSGPRLTQPPGQTRYGYPSFSDVKPHSVRTFGSLMVCLDQKGKIRVTKVTPDQVLGGPIKLTEYGFRVSPWWLGKPNQIAGEPGDLAQNHFKPVGDSLSLQCKAKTNRGYEMAVALSLPSEKGSVVHGLKINYVSDGKQESYVYPTYIAMCPGDVGPTGKSCA